jgi:hypothetical protein
VACADFKGLRVLPASGRNGLGKVRAGPDVEAAGVARKRAGTRGSAGGVAVSLPVSD